MSWWAAFASAAVATIGPRPVRDRWWRFRADLQVPDLVRAGRGTEIPQLQFIMSVRHLETAGHGSERIYRVAHAARGRRRRSTRFGAAVFNTAADDARLRVVVDQIASYTRSVGTHADQLMSAGTLD